MSAEKCYLCKDMVLSEQIKDLRERAATLEKCLDIAAKREDAAQREVKSQAPDFWNDPKEAESFLKALSGVKAWITDYDAMASAVDDLEVLAELIADIAVTFTQVKHLYRINSKTLFSQCGGNQAPKSQQAAAHVDILCMPGITQIVDDITSIARHYTTGHDQ